MIHRNIAKTLGSPGWKIIHGLSVQLHCVIRSYRDCPWSPDRRSKGCTIVRSRQLFKIFDEILTGRIREDCYDAERLPVISLDIWKTDDANRRVTVRIGLVGEGKEVYSLGLASLAKASIKDRKFSLKGLRRGRLKRPRSGSYQWWIDPDKTPVEVTNLVLSIYLEQAGVWETSNGVDSIGLIRTVLSTNRWLRDDPSCAYVVLQRLLKTFSMPQHWKGLRKYMARAVWAEAAKGSSRLADMADRLGIHPRTAYRAIRREIGSQSMRPRILAQEDGPAEAILLGHRDRTILRRALQRAHIVELGKSPDAARKAVYRAYRAGRNYEDQLNALRDKLKTRKEHSIAKMHRST